MTLSVCIIARNERQQIDDCLASVADVADEAIVVDTGSTDDTKEIAEARGARTYGYRWRGDFSAARNFALDKAKGDWILQLDADERLHAASIDLVRELVQADDVDAYACLLISPVEETNLDGALTDQYPRLFRRTAFRYEGAVRERLVPVSEGGATIGLSGVTIFHLAYLDEAGMKTKAKGKLAMLRRALKGNPEDPDLHWGMGLEYTRLGRLADAVKAFDQAEFWCQITDEWLYASIVVERCRCLIALGRLDEAAEQIESVRQEHYDYTDAQYLAGELYARRGEPETALDCFELCSRLPDTPPDIPSSRMGLNRLSVRSAGVCLRNLGREEEAAAKFTDYLSTNPGDAFSFAHLASIRISADGPADAQQQLAGVVDWSSPEIQAVWRELTSGS